jgi:hypothetical protein
MTRLHTYVEVKDMYVDTLVPVENDPEFECKETPTIVI